jgi:ATP-dependent Clp protease ATP-binding subunit ClpC
MFERFTDPARRVVVDAQERARQVGAASIDVEHLLLGVLESPAGPAFGLDAERLVAGLKRGEAPDGALPFSDGAKEVLRRGLRLSLRRRSAVIAAGDLGRALLDQEGVPGLLEGLGVDLQQLPVRLADAARAESDASRALRSEGRSGPNPPPPVPSTEPAAETLVVRAPSPAATGDEPCPACGDTDARRHETRRIPNPEGGRGSVMARVAVCGACGETLGIG